MYLQTLTLLQSSALRTVPLKYDTWTKCFLSRDCISASGKKLNKKIKTTDQRVTSNMKIMLLIKCYISDTFGCALSANLLFFETFWCHLWFLEQTELHMIYLLIWNKILTFPWWQHLQQHWIDLYVGNPVRMFLHFPLWYIHREWYV